jgi:Xaa-Pro aminopeptidase
MRRNFRVNAAVLLTLFVVVARAEGDTKGAAPAIRVAPPAPVFADAERVGELRQRRARVAERIGPGGAMVLFSSVARVYANDVDYVFRQENNLYYLTHLKQQGATLVLLPGNPQTPEILFLPRRDPRQETWTGKMYSPAEAQRLSGVGEIWDANEFKPFVEALKARRAYRPQPPNILLSSNLTNHAAPSGYEKLFAAMQQKKAALWLLHAAGDEREYGPEKEFAKAMMAADTGLSVESAAPLFAEMRLRKSPSELKRLQHAIDITTEGIGRAMAVAGRVNWEYEVQAEVEYTFRRRNADYWGYPSIVGCGPNATTLHYEEAQGRVAPGQLLLMDVGAEYDHYTADITRTFPVNGKFTTEQAEIYQIVYDAQEAAARATKPGAEFGKLSVAASRVLSEGLFKLGLMTDKNSGAQLRLWYMHGLGHWLGMNVHDVGGYGVKLEPGMVFTNEPGLYIRADALDYLPKTPEWEKFKAAVSPAFQKYKNIGVRIEDDMLVTPDGVEWMTRHLPRSIPDVEDTMARAARELQARRWEARGGLLPSVAYLYETNGRDVRRGYRFD